MEFPAESGRVACLVLVEIDAESDNVQSRILGLISKSYGIKDGRLHWCSRHVMDWGIYVPLMITACASDGSNHRL